MIVALTWLTISLPFVYSYQEKITGNVSSLADLPLNNTEEETNPFGNNTEEKAPGMSNSFSEEYMHDHDDLFLLMLLNSRKNKCSSESDYIAFHGELLSPPPEA